MTLKTATVDDLLSWEPCYDEDQIRTWAGSRSEFNAMDVLRHPDISSRDKLWVVLRPELLDDRTLRLFACNCAEHVLPLFEHDYPDDNRPQTAIVVARLYANGEATEDELAAARVAALAAAWAATRAAAWAAAWAAAGTAAGTAAWTAAGTAAREVAWAVEVDWQTQNLIELIGETILEAVPC